MTTKKPSLGAGRQMSRPANPSASIPEIKPLEVEKPTNLFETQSQHKTADNSVDVAEVEIPEWSHARDCFEGRKPTAAITETLRGVTHSGYNFKSLKENQPVFLIADPFGQVVKPETGHPDPTAISVQDLVVNGKHIGYLSKTIASTITKYLNKGYHYEADITAIKGGYPGISGEMLNYGVDISIKFYAPQENKYA